MAPQRVVESFVASWNRMDLAGIVDALCEDVLYLNVPIGPIHGRDAVEKYLRAAWRFDSVDWQLLNIATSGNVVLTERVDNFTINGSRVALPVMGSFEVRDGQIAAWRDYFDLADYRAQLAAAGVDGQRSPDKSEDGRMANSNDNVLERERIRDLLARYCERLDEYDIDGVARCFSNDAIADYGAGRGGEIHGREAIAARIAEGQKAFVRTHHQLGQIRVRLDGDRAESTSYQMTWHELGSGRKDLVCLRYLDKLGKIEGDWQICYRTVEVTLVDGFPGTEWNWVRRSLPD